MYLVLNHWELNSYGQFSLAQDGQFYLLYLSNDEFDVDLLNLCVFLTLELNFGNLQLYGAVDLLNSFLDVAVFLCVRLREFVALLQQVLSDLLAGLVRLLLWVFLFMLVVLLLSILDILLNWFFVILVFLLFFLFLLLLFFLFLFILLFVFLTDNVLKTTDVLEFSWLFLTHKGFKLI